MRRVPCAGINGVPSSAAPSTSVGHKLAVPMQLLRSVGVVKNVNDDRLSLFEAQQGPWELAVVCCSRNDPIVGNFDRIGRDVERVVGLRLGGLIFSLDKRLRLAKPDSRTERASACNRASQFHKLAAGRRQWLHEALFYSVLCIPLATFVAGFALQSFDSFFRDDGNHDESRHWIGPPQTEESIEQEPHQQNGRQVSAKLGLFGIRLHGGAAQSAAHFSLCPRE